MTSLPLAVEGIESAARLDDNHGGLQSLSLVAPSDGEAFVVTDPHAPIIEHVDERAFRLRAGGFWQVHRDAPATLSNAVREALLDDVVDPTAPNLDLYGGVGLFAATLASLAGPTARVTSVESDDLAAEDAAENLSEWVGARALCASVEGFLRSEAVGSTSRHLDRYRRASVVLDPPRAGAGRGVIDTLATLHPAQIIYVACDPVALARDAAFLRDYDYRFEWARAFDMFPHTHHVEVVARFVPDGQ